jgi:hypothetical protein
MSDDAFLSGLLGDAPHGAQPAFRIDVFVRITERAQRRAALLRGLRLVAASTALGALFPAAQALGLTPGTAAPLAAAALGIALAYGAAVATVEGPRALLSRSRAALRMLQV